jgi:hypothetical protein
MVNIISWPLYPQQKGAHWRTHDVDDFAHMSNITPYQFDSKKFIRWNFALKIITLKVRNGIGAEVVAALIGVCHGTTERLEDPESKHSAEAKLYCLAKSLLTSMDKIRALRSFPWSRT